MVKDTWLKIKDGLSEQLPAHTISTWFDPINAVAQEGNDLVLEVPNQFFYDWIESHYRQNIDRVLGLLSLENINTCLLYTSDAADE